MAIVVTNITSFGSSFSGSLNSSPGIAVPAGSLIFAVHFTNSSALTFSDTQGNTYTTVSLPGRGAIFYCYNCKAMAVSDHWTWGSGSGGSYYGSIAYATGVEFLSDPYDTAFFKTTTYSGLTPSITSNVAPAVANSLVIGLQYGNLVSNAGTGWTRPPPDNNGSGTVFGGGSYKISSSIETWSPTLSGSNGTGNIYLYAFKPHVGQTYNLSTTETVTTTDTTDKVPRLYNIGTVTGNPAASSPATITVSGSGVPAHSIIVVCSDSAIAATGVTDTAGNVYKFSQIGGNQGNAYIFWSYTGNALVSGNQISIALVASTPKDIAAQAYYITGGMTAADPFDSTVFNSTVQFGGAGPVTLSSFAPWVPNTMLFGVMVTKCVATGAGTVTTSSPGWTIQNQTTSFDATSTLQYTVALATKVSSAADSLTLSGMPTNGNGSNNSFAIFGFSPAYTGITVPQLLISDASGQNQNSQVITTTKSVPAGSTLIVVASAGSGSTMTISDTVGNTYTKTTIPSGGIANKQLWYTPNCIAMPAGTVVTFVYTSDINILFYYIEAGISSIIDPFDPTQQVGSTSSISTTAIPWATPSLLVGAAWAVRPGLGTSGGTPVSPAGWSGTFPGTGDALSEWNNFTTTGSNLFVRFKTTSGTETWNPTGYTSGQYNSIFGFNSPYTGISPLRAAGTVSANAGSGSNTLVISSVTIPAGALIMVVAGSNATVASIADSASNSYTTVSINSGFKLFYSNHCNALSSGTITITYTSGTTASEVVWAGYATGAGSYDSPYFHTVSTSGATPSVIASAVPIQAKELALAFFEENLSPAIQSATWTMPAGWTKAYTGGQANPIVNYNSGFGSGASIGIGFKQTSVQDTFSPTGMTTATRPMALAAFQPAGNIFSDSVNESGALTDVVNATANLHVSRTESGALSDAPERHFITNVNVNEAGALADTEERFGIFHMSVTDHGTFTDTPSAIANLHIPHTENMTAADTANGGFVYQLSTTENVSLSDTDNAILAYTVNEHNTLADSTNAIIHPGNVLEDAIDIEDTADVGISVYRPAIFEIANLLDHVSSTVIGRPVVETIVIRDRVDVRAIYHATLNETIPLSDHIGPEQIMTSQIEPITLSEDIQGSVVGYFPIENAPLIDAIQAIANYHVGWTDLIVLTDAVDATSTTLSGNEIGNLHETSFTHVDYVVSVLEQLTFVEDIDSTWNRRNTVETISIVDFSDTAIFYTPFHVAEDLSETVDSQQDALSFARPHTDETIIILDDGDFRPIPENRESMVPSDDNDATTIYAASIDENTLVPEDDSDATITFAVTVAEIINIQDREQGTVFYWHPPKKRGVELKSVHDVLTSRDSLSDPTMSKESFGPRKPNRRC